jgi:PilZ domain
MHHERRRAPRVNVNLDVEWEGLLGRRKGTIGDLSVSGCFVLCAGDVLQGELIRITVRLPTLRVIVLAGEVVYPIDEIGFAVKFINLGKSESAFLNRLVDRAFTKQAERDRDLQRP